LKRCPSYDTRTKGSNPYSSTGVMLAQAAEQLIVRHILNGIRLSYAISARCPIAAVRHDEADLLDEIAVTGAVRTAGDRDC